jgi:hypothetical protein
MRFAAEEGAVGSPKSAGMTLRALPGGGVSNRSTALCMMSDASGRSDATLPVLGDSCPVRLVQEMAPGKVATGEPQGFEPGPARDFDMPQLVAHYRLKCGQQVGIAGEQHKSLVLSRESGMDQIDGDLDVDTLLLRRQGWLVSVVELPTDHLNPAVARPLRRLSVVGRSGCRLVVGVRAPSVAFLGAVPG